MDYNSPHHGGCINVAGCQNELRTLQLEDTLAEEDPTGSSGYGGQTDVTSVLKQIQTLNTQELNTPNIPAPIKRAGRQVEDP